MKNIINMLKRGDELMPLTMIDEGTPYTSGLAERKK